MFRDNYTNFTFDDLRSENFKVWITNKNDLKRNMSPNFSDKFNTPTYGQIRYHEGTTIDKQDFKFSCVAVDVTLNEWRAITEWLSPLKSGKLVFDWNDKYYYMVKLSKAPSGTMFMKSKIDNVMGQLFIITFDLEFTTVYDWAALGPYCEQEMYAKDESDNIVYTNIDPSIYNNSYYIPQILKINKITRKNDNSNTIIQASKNEHRTSNGANIIYFHADDSGDIYIKLPDNYEIYKISTDKIKYTLYSNVADTGEEWVSIGDLPIITINKKSFASIRIPQKQVIFFSKTMDFDYFLERNENVAFCNPASFDMYPMFYAPTNNFKVEHNYNTLYSYEANGSAYGSARILINNQQFSFTYGGKNIESVTNSMQEPLFTNIHINKPLSVSSGRPELIKAYFLEHTVVGALCTATFLLNNKLIYDRYNSFIVNVFNDSFMTDVNIFNKHRYSEEYYSLDTLDATSKVTLLVDPILSQRYVEGKGWILDIKYIVENDNSNWIGKNYSRGSNKYHLIGDGGGAEGNFQTGQFLYLSICDCDWFNITSDNSWAMGCNARDVI